MKRVEACVLKVWGNLRGIWPSGCSRRDQVGQARYIRVVEARVSVRVGNRRVVVRLRWEICSWV